MKWIWTLQSNTGEAIVATARSSQALVIETLDRAAGAREHGTLPLLHGVGRLQFEVVSLLLDDPAGFVDAGYELVQQLTALHREFAQRLFEVVDPRELPAEGSAASTGKVLPFPARRASAP